MDPSFNFLLVSFFWLCLKGMQNSLQSNYEVLTQDQFA